MTLPTPPRYVVLPEEVIEQAFAPDKPRRALLASFTRILSLAWESKYHCTPALDELELMAFLKLSRRQYYEQLADMALIGWLRSSHPRPGFVQFTFSRSVADKAASAENRTPSAENPDLKGGGKESESNLNSDPPPTQAEPSAENRTFPSTAKILSFTELLFGETHLVYSKDIEDRDPLEALAWCAYAYKSRISGAAGIVRNRLRDRVPASPWAKEQWQEILPGIFLEALGLIRYTCPQCDAVFGKMLDMQAHLRTHPRRFACPHCDQTFGDEIELDTHIDAEHQPRTVQADESVRQALREGSTMTAEQAWQSVLGQLQMEMPRASFETYVRDTQAVRYDRNSSTLTIGARNAYAREWLESRLASTVRRLLVGIMNTNVCVEFVVRESEAEDA